MAEASKLVDDGGMKLTCLLLFVLLAGCTQERPSEIVQRVQNAGAGDVRSASQQSLEQWFRQHADIANEIKGRCAPIQQSAPATWGDSTEGRVCKAASVATVFQFTPRKGDGRGFESGQQVVLFPGEPSGSSPWLRLFSLPPIPPGRRLPLARCWTSIGRSAVHG